MQSMMETGSMSGNGQYCLVWVGLELNVRRTAFKDLISCSWRFRMSFW